MLQYFTYTSPTAEVRNNNNYSLTSEHYLKVSATLKIAIFPYLRFQRFQIDMFESFLLKKNLLKDIQSKRFFLVNYLN